MPAPDPKVIRKLQSLADLLWQAERVRLAEALAETEARTRDAHALSDQRGAERAIATDCTEIGAMIAAVRYENWADGRADALLAARDVAISAESVARDRAIEEFGRVRALEHIEKIAVREQDRRRRASQERDGQPEG
jgi:hypothetical protein